MKQLDSILILSLHEFSEGSGRKAPDKCHFVGFGVDELLLLCCLNLNPWVPLHSGLKGGMTRAYTITSFCKLYL